MALTGVMDGCAWCEKHKQTWSEPKTIQRGFKLTRSLAGLQELWLSLDKDSHGELIRRRDDYSVRKGLCHKPVTTRDLFHFTICHKVDIYCIHYFCLMSDKSKLVEFNIQVASNLF